MAIICIVLLIVICEFDYVSRLFVRDFYFREYIKDDQQIYFLGSDHKLSLDSEPFSYLNLKSVIENLKPDILLIESRPEQLANGNWADGPPEMLYSHLIANNLVIAVRGVDWFDPNAEVSNSTDALRDNHINENILKNIAGHKKVLIFMGNHHVSLEQPKLEIAGYKKVFFSETKKIKLFKINDKKLIYPKGMNYYIQKRISYEINCVGDVYKMDIQELNRISKIVEQAGEAD